MCYSYALSKASNSNQCTEEDDLTDIMEEIVSIKCMYFQLGRSLRLKHDDLQTIYEAYRRDSDTDKALNDVLLLWLHQKYNVERFGPPTWRLLVEAVNKKSGGNNHDLAKQVASNHPEGENLIVALYVYV